MLGDTAEWLVREGLGSIIGLPLQLWAPQATGYKVTNGITRTLQNVWKNECISVSVLSVAWVMIAQWENGCISLSVLSVVRVMIAQWENECISLSVFSMA